MSTFADAKAAAARQGCELDADQRDKVEAGQPYTITLPLTLRLPWDEDDT